jgi:hypothetical protein
METFNKPRHLQNYSSSITWYKMLYGLFCLHGYWSPYHFLGSPIFLLPVEIIHALNWERVYCSSFAKAVMLHLCTERV